MVVDDESSGQRLDNFLMRQLKGVPKTHVYQLIRSGQVRLNRGRASADTRIACGDQVRVPPVRVSEHAQAKAQAMSQRATQGSKQREFAMLYEDDALLALDKPAGVAVHGGSGISFGVIEQLRMARPQAPLLELVHRLDRETSGVLLVAKKRSVLKDLQQQFRSRQTAKTYLALVQGTWPANKKVIDAPLRKTLKPVGADGHGAGERHVKVTMQDDPEGQSAVTLVKVLARLQRAAHSSGTPTALTLLEVTIKTGRTHQIRVHLAAQGHPIVGDDKYGDFEANKSWAKLGLKRMFLHAWRLAFDHCLRHERITLQADLPAPLKEFLDACQAV